MALVPGWEMNVDDSSSEEPEDVDISSMTINKSSRMSRHRTNDPSQPNSPARPPPSSPRSSPRSSARAVGTGNSFNSPNVPRWAASDNQNEGTASKSATGKTADIPLATSSPQKITSGVSAHPTNGDDLEADDTSDISTIANFLFAATETPPDIHQSRPIKRDHKVQQRRATDDGQRSEQLSYEELKARLIESEKQLAECQKKLNGWITAAREALNAVALSPSSNEKYKNEICEQLQIILGKLEQVKEVRYINCSFPAIKGQAPVIDMLSWTSLDKSEWKVKWKPSWSVEVSLDGQHYIPFRLLIRVSNISLDGQLTLKLSPNIDFFWVSFHKNINFAMNVDVDVTWGVVPLPIRATISAMVRKGFDDWLRNSLVEPNKMRFIGVPRKSNPGVISDADIEKAKAAAEQSMRRVPMGE